MPSHSITFNSHINPQHAEAAVEELGSEETPSVHTLVDLSQCVFVDPSAGWRLANALRRHANAGLLDVVVPPRDALSSEKWFKAFTRSGLGYAIAHHCACVRDSAGNDLTDEIKKYYQRIEGEKGSTHLLLAGVRRNRPFNIDEFGQFNSKFQDRLAKLRGTQASPEDLHYLATFVFEAIQNIYDHAHSSPLPRETPIYDYLCVNYHANIRNPPDVANRLVQYLKRLPELLPEKQKIAGYMEVVVNDDGVGIAARQSQAASIYWQHDLYWEKNELMEALSQGGSIKFSTHDCPIRHDPGLGTQKILDALRRLRAFAFIRTGRLLAYFDGGDQAQTGFQITNEQLGYMPGTGIEVILPIVERQLHLAFE